MKFSDIELHSLDKEKVKVLSIEEENEMDILKELGLPANASYYKIYSASTSIFVLKYFQCL